MATENYKKFNVLDVNLAGKNLIEAAAGTGKTYSIAIMVLRWILETENAIDSVLAVTFTNYATAELKERILDFLEKALDFFETSKCDDKTIETLCKGFSGKKTEKKLKKAINDFDTASIFTIHGFCQKLIKEHAFELGIDFKMELSKDADPAGDAARTFFRQNIVNCDLKDQTGKRLLDEKKSREKVSIKELTEFISKAGIGVENDSIKIENPEITFAGQIAEIYKDFAEKAPAIARNNRNRKNVMGFDDILLIIYEVLKEKEGSAAQSLQKIMAEHYSFVLIDEFQDTDPFQYFIFKKLFCNGRHTVFFIGDPKQSIYSFRKADIFSYIETKKDVDRIYSMETNFRSSPAAVGAANDVFSKKNIFGDDSLIKYNAVSAAKTEDEYALTLNSKKFPGMLVRELPNRENGKEIKAEVLKNLITDHIAYTIQEMTKQGSDFRIREKNDGAVSERAVNYSDIAVLVAKNDFALEVCEKLKSCDIPAIVETDTAKHLSIFSSDEAISMQRLVAAAATGGIAEFKTLLLSFFYNTTVDDIANENFSLNELHKQFISCFEEWEQKGFYAVFSKFLEDKEILDNIAERGERAVSILRQLAELIHKHEVSEGFSPLRTQKWFNEKIKSKSGMEDEIIRTESDKTDCVRVMTLHKSKGLEFNIVFFPFILNQERNEKWVLQHTKTENGYKRDIILMPAKNLNQTVIGALPNDEKLEEKRRIYVGITRAKYLTVCYTQEEKRYLEATSVFKNENSSFIHTDTIKIKKCETKSAAAEEKHSPETVLAGRPEEATREIKPDWALSSFSSIISSGQSSEESAATADEDPENDYMPLTKEETTEEENIPMVQFPKGTEAGTILHTILENSDFASENNSETIRAILKKKMNFKSKEELETMTATVNDCINSLCSVPMFEGGKTLRDVGKDEKTSEMEFFITIKNDMQKGELSQIISDNYKTEELEGDNVRKGFLQGFIDLVVKVDGKYYIIDWKSNYLGESFSDYDEKHLREEMKKHNYYLQFMLYLTAFDRYMTTLDPEYSYAKDFGGIRYVFLRGIKTGNRENGIFAEKPDEKQLRQIQELF